MIDAEQSFCIFRGRWLNIQMVSGRLNGHIQGFSGVEISQMNAVTLDQAQTAKQFVVLGFKPVKVVNVSAGG